MFNSMAATINAAYTVDEIIAEIASRDGRDVRVKDTR